MSESAFIVIDGKKVDAAFVDFVALDDLADPAKKTERAALLEQPGLIDDAGAALTEAERWMRKERRAYLKARGGAAKTYLENGKAIEARSRVPGAKGQQGRALYRYTGAMLKADLEADSGVGNALEKMHEAERCVARLSRIYEALLQRHEVLMVLRGFDPPEMRRRRSASKLNAVAQAEPGPHGEEADDGDAQGNEAEAADHGGPPGSA